MKYVDKLINRTKAKIYNLEEAYLLDKEILKFLNNNNVTEEDKIKLRNEGLLEVIAILSDGYKKQKKLEHYSTQK